MRVQNQPKGVDLVIEAVHALDEAKKARLQVEIALQEAKTRESEAESRLHELIAQGRCDHGPNPEPSPVPSNGSTTSAKVNGRSVPLNLDDKTIPICWRIAWMLVAGPQLDYQQTAERIWGSGLDKTVAKNRVNAQVTRLKKLGVAKTLGGNRFEIDRQKLEVLSKLPVSREATS